MSESVIVDPEMFDAARVVAIDLEVQQSWQGSENGGWHKSWDKLTRDIQNGSALDETAPRTQEDVTNWVVNKLMLVVSELAEAQDELRSGHGLTEVYYSDSNGEKYSSQLYSDDGVPQFKPEGFLVELADAVIRIEDLVGIVTEGEPSFGQIKLDKIQFNATRGKMHGGRKF